jgi:hypothetical protein
MHNTLRTRWCLRREVFSICLHGYTSVCEVAVHPYSIQALYSSPWDNVEPQDLARPLWVSTRSLESPAVDGSGGWFAKTWPVATLDACPSSGTCLALVVRQVRAHLLQLPELCRPSSLGGASEIIINMWRQSCGRAS